MKYRKQNIFYFFKRNLNACLNFIIFYLYRIFHVWVALFCIAFTFYSIFHRAVLKITLCEIAPCVDLIIIIIIIIITIIVVIIIIIIVIIIISVNFCSFVRLLKKKGLLGNLSRFYPCNFLPWGPVCGLTPGTDIKCGLSRGQVEQIMSTTELATSPKFQSRLIKSRSTPWKGNRFQELRKRKTVTAQIKLIP